jgi:hypothetical protein
MGARRTAGAHDRSAAIPPRPRRRAYRLVLFDRRLPFVLCPNLAERIRIRLAELAEATKGSKD